MIIYWNDIKTKQMASIEPSKKKYFILLMSRMLKSHYKAWYYIKLFCELPFLFLFYDFYCSGNEIDYKNIDNIKYISYPHHSFGHVCCTEL
jgi:hypothetical protein